MPECKKPVPRIGSIFDFKEYARQLRENCVKNENGAIICSPELWEEIASVIECFSSDSNFSNCCGQYAFWEYWSGWVGNHDQRIEDATCSNCGYVHPTVRLDFDKGENFRNCFVPAKLPSICPNCEFKMYLRG